MHDAIVLGDMRAALFREVGTHAPPGEFAGFESAAGASFGQVLEREQCCAWLAEDEHELAIGCAALLIFPRIPTPSSLARVEGHLSSVYTVPAWRRRGVSSALVAAAVAKARELGMGRIRLHATAEGRPVYTAAGFRLRDDEMELKL